MVTGAAAKAKAFPLAAAAAGGAVLMAAGVVIPKLNGGVVAVAVLVDAPKLKVVLGGMLWLLSWLALLMVVVVVSGIPFPAGVALTIPKVNPPDGVAAVLDAAAPVAAAAGGCVVVINPNAGALLPNMTTGVLVRTVVAAVVLGWRVAAGVTAPKLKPLVAALAVAAGSGCVAGDGEPFGWEVAAWNVNAGASADSGAGVLKLRPGVITAGCCAALLNMLVPTASGVLALAVGELLKLRVVAVPAVLSLPAGQAGNAVLHYAGETLCTWDSRKELVQQELVQQAETGSTGSTVHYSMPLLPVNHCDR